jgi:hypothetical protein
VGVSPHHGQTTVETNPADLFVGLMTIADLDFFGADDGNRTRVFSLGSRFDTSVGVSDCLSSQMSCKRTSM